MKIKLTTPGTRAVGWWLDQVRAKVSPPPTLVAGRHRYYCCTFDHAKQDQQHHQQMQLCSLLESENPTLGGLIKKRWFLVAWVQMLPLSEKSVVHIPEKNFHMCFFVENWKLHVWIGFYSHTANLSLPILSIETVFWTINALFHGIYCISHREKAKWECFLG